MKISFKNKTIGFWLGFAAAALGFLALIFFAAYGAVAQAFSVPVFIVVLIGVACGVVTVFFDFSFLSVIMAAMFGLAFGLYLKVKVPLYALYFTNTWAMSGGNESIGAITALLIILFVCVLLSVVSSFIRGTKVSSDAAAKQEEENGKAL